MIAERSIVLSLAALAGCMEAAPTDDRSPQTGAQSGEMTAFEAIKARRNDVDAGIWTDPDGCFHYIGEQPNGEGYLQELIGESGEPVCNE